MSMPPKASTVAATAARTWSSSRMSQRSASARPPRASISAAAVWMVPGRRGLGTEDFAAIATLAPSAAARRAMARPMPRDAPVTNSVLPFRDVDSMAAHCAPYNPAMPTAWFDGTIAWITAHPRAAGLLILLIAFCDALAVVGIVVPALPLLFAVGALVGLGHIDGPYAIACARSEERRVGQEGSG